MKKKIPQVKTHKVEAQCFNKCIEWKLTISFSQLKTNYSTILTGKGLFFKRLEKSILNILQSKSIKQDKTPPKSYLLNFIDMSNTQLLSQGNPERDDDILNIKFPINNAEFNYMIIDSNLGSVENLNNIFFLEFDLTVNKESQKLLREINNDCVERESFFLLNGYMHGTPLFSSDLKFSVETRKFIKSIQFKLESYKHEIIQKKQMLKGQAQAMRNYFFAKVISNTNLGIEFHKPYFDPQQPENFLTNFNSVVNSNITLNKIFLEVCIPKIFINNGLQLTTSVSASDNANINSFNKPVSDLAMEKFQINSCGSNKIYTKNINIHKDKPITLSSEKKIPPLYDIDFKNIKDNKFNSPAESFARVIKNNTNANSNSNSNHHYFSPDYVQMNHPSIYGNLSGINTTNTSSLYFSPNYTQYMQLSPNSIPYLSQNMYMQSRINPQIQPIEFENSYNMIPRRLSENNYEKMIENPLSSYCNSSVNSARSHMNQTMNIIRSPPLNNRINPDLVLPFNQGQRPVAGNLTAHYDDSSNFYGLANNGFVSPRAVSNFKFGFDYGMVNVNNQQNTQGGIPTIHKKIMDWEKLNNKTSNMKEEPQKQPMAMAMPLTLKEKKVKMYLQHYDGLCNFLLFLRGSTPYILKKNIESFKYMTIRNFFKAFSSFALFGLKVTYFSDNNKFTLNDTIYIPCLSSMEMTFTHKETLLAIVDILIQLKLCQPNIRSIITEEELPNPKVNYSYMEYSPSDKLPGFKVILRDLSSITLEYNEPKPPHNRPLLLTQLDQILNLFELKHKFELNKLTSNSWFCILWSPSKSQNSKFMSTSFLTYYQFKYSEESLSKQTSYAEIPIIGILPNKMIHELFLERINQNYQKIYDAVLLKSSIENVTNIVLHNANRTSVDVEYYLKNNGSIMIK